MTVFDSYAATYDLLYEDKDYEAEAAYVLSLLREQVPDVVDLLELGCGTGAHASILSRRGVKVHGIDFSPEMLRRAERRFVDGPAHAPGRPTFALGDVRDYRDGRRRDAVISLFHVMSYQTTDADLAAAFRTAADHLRPGGVFLFDFWYGPAVLVDPPAVRIKRVENAEFKVTRLAEPSLHHERDMVEVDYQVFCERVGSGQVEQFREKHHLRFWFWPELQRHLAAAGLEPVGIWKWMTREPVGPRDWLACIVCRKPWSPEST